MVEDLLVFVLVLEGLVNELCDGLTVQHQAFGHGGLGSQPETLHTVKRFESFIEDVREDLVYCGGNVLALTKPMMTVADLACWPFSLRANPLGPFQILHILVLLRMRFRNKVGTFYTLFF